MEYITCCLPHLVCLFFSLLSFSPISLSHSWLCWGLPYLRISIYTSLLGLYVVHLDKAGSIYFSSIDFYYTLSEKVLVSHESYHI